MEITFSRHAKRRGKLYKIPEATVRKILDEKVLIEGDQEIMEDVEGFKYPLKVVISVEGDTITVVTNYPVKKGRKG